MIAARRLAVVLAAALATVAPAAAGETVMVPDRVIYPGETVTLDALREVELGPGRIIPKATATAAAEIEGKVARRTLLPGRYIAAASLRDAYLVDRGAAVQLLFVAGSLTIAATAVALEPGAAGALIKVRNIDSGKIVTGTVMADGTVRVSAS